jgi:energy-coupling factor transporter transmembrane protein EcfT
VLAAVAIAAGLTVGGPARDLAVGSRRSLPRRHRSHSPASCSQPPTPIRGDEARIGPFRLTVEAAEAAAALAARVLAIVAVGAVFAQSTDPTRLVDSLVQQARVPERFAYGAIAAYQAVPRLGEDLATLRQARRIRGLGGGWHRAAGRLVRAIRHADQLALAMDAGLRERARTTIARWNGACRTSPWGWGDIVALWFTILR